MFCCFPFTRRLVAHTQQSDEKKPLATTSEPKKVKYQTIITIPYAHILRDDKIQIDSTGLIETTALPAYFLLDGIIPDQDYETKCFSFDDTNVSSPVVIATQTATTGLIPLERLYQIEHVTAINPSSTTRPDAVPAARPFDEFSADPTGPNPPADEPKSN